MRISSRAIVDNVLVNLQRNFARLDQLQGRLSSGKQVRFVSDDPGRATTSMRLQSAVLENRQYLKNADAATGWMEVTDSALQDVVSTLHRVRELTVYAARGDLPDTARGALADELDQLLRHVVQVANTAHAGRFLFAGSQTGTTPYAIAATDPTTGYVTEVAYFGDAAALEVELGPGLRQRINVSGSEVFAHGAASPVPGSVSISAGDFDASGLFGVLMKIRDDARAGDVASLSDTDLVSLDRALDRVLESLNQVGARSEGLQLVAQRLQGEEVNLKELLSKAEDLDVAEAIMELKMQENVYRLALASGARVLQPTLLDFLR